jgi:hypothetical protein
MRHSTILDHSSQPDRRRKQRRRALRHSVLLLTLCAVPLSAGCGDPNEELEGIITREEFVRAFSELRVSALREESGDIAPEERDRILAGLGLTPEDLIDFVEAHGRDMDFMQEVWEEVDHNLETRRNAGSDSFVT